MIRSAALMSCLWMGCVVMGLIYLIFMWDGESPLAFVLGQVVLGILGLAREQYVATLVQQL